MKSLLILLFVLLGFLNLNTNAAPFDNPQNQSENVDQLIQEAIDILTEEGIASNDIYRFIKEHLLSGEETSVTPPCFIKERSDHGGDISPQTNYTQLFIEDYESANNFFGYIQRVEERYNETMNTYPNCDYCVKFRNVQQKTKQLVTKLDSLVEAIDLTLPTPSENDTTVNSNREGIQEHCTNLCPEQQVDIFMRLDIFASVYLTDDLTGLREQLKAK